MDDLLDRIREAYLANRPLRLIDLFDERETMAVLSEVLTAIAEKKAFAVTDGKDTWIVPAGATCPPHLRPEKDPLQIWH